MGEVKVQSHNMGPTFSRLTSLSFHVNRPSHSWDAAFSKFDLENPSWRSYIAQGHKVGITPYWLISLSFHFNRPSHYWDTAIWKFNVENSRSRSWVRSKFKVTTWVQHSVNILFIPCQSGIPFLSYDFFKISFLSYDFFKIWPWKSRIKVMGDVTVQSHNVGLASYRITSLSFHVNRPSHSSDTAFSKFDLKNPGSRSNDYDVAQLQVNSIELQMV